MQEKIKEAFECNPELNVLHATSDGQCFAKPNEARMHAKSLEDDKVQVHYRGSFEVVEEAPEEAPKLSAEERIAKINECATVEEVDLLMNGEKAKTVIAAGEAKIKELNEQSI
jgi:hypothetical protein